METTIRRLFLIKKSNPIARFCHFRFDFFLTLGDIFSPWPRSFFHMS